MGGGRNRRAADEAQRARPPGAGSRALPAGRCGLGGVSGRGLRVRAHGVRSRCTARAGGRAPPAEFGTPPAERGTPPNGALAAFFGFDQNLPRISFQKRLFGRSVASFFGFDQMATAFLVKTEHSCRRKAEKRGSRCETARQFGQNRKKLPGASGRMAGRRSRADRGGATSMRPRRKRKGRAGRPRARAPAAQNAQKDAQGGADSGRAHSPGRCARIPTRKRRRRRERSQPVRSFDSARPAGSLCSG